MNNSIKLSIVIISFNSWDLLKRCLNSIYLNKSIKKEIIIVDNNSSDETRKMLKNKKYKDIKLILNNENAGHPKAVNQGFRLSKGEYILLLDNDTELLKDTIKLLTEFLEHNKEISMVSPKTLNTDGSIQMTARNFPSIMNAFFGRKSFLTKLFPNNIFSKKYLLNHKYKTNTPFKVEQISAACMFFRRNILDEVGYFDEKYRGYWVDTDWCKSFQKLKKNIFCIPEAVIFHHEQNKANQKLHPSRIINFHSGILRLYRKNYTYGYIDPRFYIGGLFIILRTILQLSINNLKKSKHSNTDPLSIDNNKN